MEYKSRSHICPYVSMLTEIGLPYHFAGWSAMYVPKGLGYVCTYYVFRIMIRVLSTEF